MNQPRPKIPLPAVIGASGLGLLVLVATALRLIGRAFIRKAYTGESLPVLNRMLAGRDHVSLQEYLDTLDGALRSGAVLGAMLVLGFAVLSSERVRRRLDRWLRGPGGNFPGSSTPRRLGALPVLVAGVFVSLQSLGVLTQVELWPFSPYAMYSGRQPNPFSFLHLVAVTDSGEVRLPVVPPFNRSGLSESLEAILSTRDPSRLHRALASLASLAERDRRFRSPKDPPVRSVRLYRKQWTLDPMLHNLDRPDRAALLAEVRVPER